jgi:hypothetical protein
MNFNYLLLISTFLFGMSLGFSYSLNNNYLLNKDYKECEINNSTLSTLDAIKLNQILIDDSEIVPSASVLIDDLSNVIEPSDSIHYQIIKQYHKLALEEQNLYGFPASVKLAQMILEGGYSVRNPYGSILVQTGNNPFGIKYFGDFVPNRINNWDEMAFKSEWVSLIDDCGDFKCKFIKFKSIEQSFRFHSEFMVGSISQPSHYLKWLNKGDWEDWLYAIEQGGYATDKEYANKLKKLIVDYRLYLIDDYSIYFV